MKGEKPFLLYLIHSSFHFPCLFSILGIFLFWIFNKDTVLFSGSVWSLKIKIKMAQKPHMLKHTPIHLFSLVSDKDKILSREVIYRSLCTSTPHTGEKKKDKKASKA